MVALILTHCVLATFSNKLIHLWASGNIIHLPLLDIDLIDPNRSLIKWYTQLQKTVASKFSFQPCRTNLISVIAAKTSIMKWWLWVNDSPEFGRVYLKVLVFVSLSARWVESFPMLLSPRWRNLEELLYVGPSLYTTELAHFPQVMSSCTRSEV